MTAPIPTLHQFATSHFNEKARWGLDWKAVPHRRIVYPPGPHVPFIRRLSAQTSTPVLEIEGSVVAGSARILEELETRFEARPLYPDDPSLRERALALQRDFDAEVGPAVRTALFSVMVGEPDFLCRVFSGHRSSLGRAAYRASFPLAKRMMSRAHDTDRPERVERAFELSRLALDRVSREVGPSGQLVGESFGVADLCCAALLAPLAAPDHPDMRMPEPVPEAVQDFYASWAGHETVAWVHEQYRRHRPATAAL